MDEQYPIWMTLCYAVCTLGYIISKIAFPKDFIKYCDLVNNSIYNIKINGYVGTLCDLVTVFA